MKGNLRKLAALLLVAVMALFAIGAAPSAQAAQNPNPGVTPPQAHPYGHTYGEWANMYWQWAFSIPVHDEQGNILNPMIDPTGVDCAVGQSGPVWFLGGVISNLGPNEPVVLTRNCTIPPGKGIFFQVLSAINDNVSWDPSPQHFTELQLRQWIEDLLHSFDGCPACSVEVDGMPLTGIFGDTDRIGYGNPAYTVTMPDDNIYRYIGFDVPGQTFPEPGQINDGWFVMLAPLSTGQHTVHFHTALEGAMNWDVTYNLTIGH